MTSTHSSPPSASNPACTARTVFFVSDGTGITAETFGNAVLAQFEGVRFHLVRMPFVDTFAKADDACARITQAIENDGYRPIVFSTLVNPDIVSKIEQSGGLFMNLIATFVAPLEAELGKKSTHSIGRSHNISDTERYKNRIEAINFSLAHDDGQSYTHLDEASVILIGVSRSGKTPTSLYLAMQYGLKVANCPLIPEDFDRDELPSAIQAYRHKLFGLSITPERLHSIRSERRPNSRYAALDNCRYEVQAAEALMRREGIHWLSSTHKSIEEIATTILQCLQLDTAYKM